MRKTTQSDYGRLAERLARARGDSCGFGKYEMEKLAEKAAGCDLRVYRRFRVWAQWVQRFDTLAVDEWYVAHQPYTHQHTATGRRPEEGLWFGWLGLCQCHRKNAVHSYEAFLRISTVPNWKPSEPVGSEEVRPYWIALDYSAYLKEINANEAREGVADVRCLGPYPESVSAWVRLAKGIQEIQLYGGNTLPTYERG